MSARRVLGLVGLAGFVMVAAAPAQGLGDLAAREKAKRTQTKKPEGRVFTNDDLDAGKPPGEKKEEGAAAAEPAASGAPEVLRPLRDESRQQDDKIYVDALRAAEAEVTAVETRIRELSSRLNPMSTTYIYGAGGSNDANEELRLRDELRQAEEQLIAARQAVVSASRNLQDFRAGRPIGSDEPR